jgi:hypothetical protein
MNYIKAFLKKYSALILPACLLLAGLFLFVPTMLVGRAVDAKKKNVQQTAQELDSLAQTTPSKIEADQVSQVLERMKKEVETVQLMALQMTQRELIKYGLFPKSTDSSSQVYLDFGRRYRAAIEQLVTERLKALDAPSEAEIRARSGQPGAGAGYPGGGGMAGEYMGAGVGAPGAGRTAATLSSAVDALCLAKAENIRTYANPRIFAWYDFWDSYQFSGSEQALQDCWMSQTAYWIYEDVVATIEVLNKGSERTADSPVKRLMGVSFQRPVSDFLSPGSAPGGMGGMGGYGGTGGMGGYGGIGRTTTSDIPAFVLLGRSSPLISKPWTGRTGNADLDVVHFAVSVIVDNRFVQAFLKELCSSKPHAYREGFQETGKVVQAQHNQITILQSTFSSVDKQSQTHLYYRYGTDAVMRIDLVCEYLFTRKAYDEIKPEPVKLILEQSAQSQGMGMGAGVGGMQ